MTQSIVQRGDVGVVEAGEHSDFAQEALGDLFAGLYGEQHLHRFNPLRDGVANLIHLADATGAKRTNHLIVADQISNVESHESPLPSIIMRRAAVPPTMAAMR